MKYRDKNVTIGEVGVELPDATEVFKEFGIDFCCGGHRNLVNVIIEQKIDKEALFTKLDKLYEERKASYEKNNNRFDQMSPEVLTTYIQDTHHEYLRRVLPETADLFNRILRAHGKNHQELFDMYRIFGQLKTDLEQHLLKEETMLFPDFDELEDNKQEIIELTQMIINEHEAAGELLGKLRKISGDYHLPEDACQTFAKTYRLLEDIEDDLHQHIHLENNILLKNYVKR
ncbi:MAG: iron-sulfur cluster repair di-iron protein [Herbinix sp.]|nr:iron-sulfur cluster repair di-iron protein [Herbinix sp.]